MERNMTTDRMRALAFALGLVAAAAPVRAQERQVAIDEHWRGYLGCWSTSVGGAPGPMVCLVPTADRRTVDMMTVVGDSITSSTAISATGAKVRRTRDGCTGWETGRWSMDERRLYTTAEYTCGDGVPQQSSGMFAMYGSDTFSRIEGVTTKGGMRVRVMRFDAQNDTAIIPASIARRLPGLNSLPMLGARAEAGASLTTANVADAAKAVDAPVVEAWLADRNEALVLAAKDLRALHEAGVPGSVVDMLVAVSNPTVFALAAGGRPDVRAQDPFERRANNADFSRRRREQMLMMALHDASLWGYGMGGFGWGNFGYGMNAGFLPYSMLGFGGGFPLSFWSPYNNFGFNGFNNGWLPGNTPYVIVPREPSVAERNGRAVNGRGYTQGGSGGGTAQPTGSVNSGGYSGGNSGGSTGGSVNTSSGGASTGVESGGGRTAKPRP